MKDEFGQIEQGAYDNALRQIARLKTDVTRAFPSQNVWSEIGPHNVTGRTRSLLIHPTQANRMWMGAVSGGIWYSQDSGANWEPVNDKLPNLNINCLVFEPNNPNVMYAGTGEGYFNSDAKQGSGLFKSTDGGQTWSLVTGTSGFGNINKIAISPANVNTILVTTQYGGVRRTTNGGTSWSTVLSAQVGHDVEFSPTDSNRVMATVLDYDFGTGSWFTRASHSNDAGATWTVSTGMTFSGFDPRIEVAFAPSAPGTVYANVGAGGGVVFRSTDNGASFTQVTTSGNTDASWYYNDIWVDPTNSNFIIATGLRCRRSTDGGMTFTNIGYGYLQTETPHPDMHKIVPHPGYNATTNRTVYICTDGGIHRADDISTASSSSGWTRLTRNASTMQFYGAAGDGPTGVLFGGSQDNGSIRLNIGSTNSTNAYVFGGDGGFSAVSFVDSSYLYGEYIYLQVFRSSNGGGSSGYITSGLSDAGNSGRANFIAPLVMDPNSASRLYGGARRLWRTSNATAGTPTWSAVGSDFSSNISAIAVRPGTPDEVWVGLNNGQVWRSTNALSGSPTFTAIDNNSGSNPFPNRYVNRIAFSPSDPTQVYVCLGGFSSNNVWKTTNSGSTWVALSNFPSAPAYGLAVHPTNPNEIWAGTEVGIVRSTNGGSTWTAPGDGPLNVAVDEVSYMHNSTKVLAATHGRGLWVYGPSEFTAFTGDLTLPAGGTGNYTLTFSLPSGAKGRTINLTSSNTTALSVPSTVKIPARASTVSFTAAAGSVTTGTNVTLTATTNEGHTADITVAVGPVSINRTQVSPSTPVGGRTGTGFKVFLTSPAPTGGAVINLTSSNPALASVPSTLSIPTGQSERSVVVTTTAVRTRTAVYIDAKYNGQTKRLYFTLEVPTPTSLSIAPYSFKGGAGTAINGTINFIVPAGASGLQVALASSDAAVSVPATLEVPAGANSVTFPITANAVTYSRDIAVRVTAGFQEKRGYGRVLAPVVIDPTLNTNTVVGGTGQAVNMTVRIDSPAPAGGVLMNLYSSNSAAARVPASVTIPAGATSATVAVTHFTVVSAQAVTLTSSSSSYGKRTVVLTVGP
jgi:hypothetical protein